MSNVSKRVLVGSMVVSALVGVAAVVDIFLKQPFAGQMTMDILFVLTAGLVIYLAYDSLQDLK